MVLLATVQPDLTPHAQGANDNASGVAVVMSLAERLAHEPLANTEVWALASGCEEVGSYGTQAFCDRRRPELPGLFGLSLDNVTGGAIVSERPDLEADSKPFTTLHTDATTLMASGGFAGEASVRSLGMPRVVTMTLNPAVDKSIRVDQVVPERKLRSDRPVHEPGGGGINVARVLHELGIHADAHWTRGGATGERLGQLLDATGIEHHPLPIAGETREHLIVFEMSSGFQFRFGTPGPMLREDELAALEERVHALQPDTPYLVLSGSLPDGAPDDTYARLAAAAPMSARVVLDTSGTALAHALDAGGVFLAKPNQRELEALAGRSVEDDASLIGAARSLIERQLVEVVVTSLGAGGALAVTAERAWHVRAPAVKALSAVGAGDSMVAGMVAALLQGRPLEAAIRFGVAAGAAAVITPGSELCRRQDVERFDAQMAAEGAVVGA